MKRLSKIQIISLIVLILMVGTVFIDIFIDLNIIKYIIWLLGFSIQLVLLHKAGISFKSKGRFLFPLCCSSLGVVLSLICLIVAIV